MSETCSPCAFHPPSLPGVQITALEAHLVENYTRTARAELYYGHPTVTVENATFCNITIGYTQPGGQDTIPVETWLPVDDYNGRLQSIGGGGWVAGRYPPAHTAMAGALSEGYATSTTDAGLLQAPDFSPDLWALDDEGGPNYQALRNLAYVSLNDQAILVKSLIADFYGQSPEYSYWSGCSQGGRQGMMLAQRYPDAYDGIHACAPAINWNDFFPYTMWPQLMMGWIDYFPFPCELDHITKEAITACDELDGVQDGIISDDSACNFDPMSLVRTSFHCTDTNTTKVISQGAATIASATWTGPKTRDGRSTWYGANTGSQIGGFTTSLTNDIGPAMTSCTSNGTCVGVPLGLGSKWFQYFIEADPDWDFMTMTHEQFDRHVLESKMRYDEIIGTNDPDLRSFYERGGKILGYHGMIDQLIPVKGTEDYYDKVTKFIPEVDEFYRVFEVPGLLHCSGGPGGQPTNTFDALRKWMENGTVPDSLPHAYTPVEGGPELERLLCPYPKKAVADRCVDH